MNLANITISEDDYKSLLFKDTFKDINVISVKILPDDKHLKEDENYKRLQKEYKKSRNNLEEYRFKSTTNKNNK